MTADDVAIPEALRQLEELGADVVGLNCGRGSHTVLPLLREVRTVCKGPIAALPVPFRTSDSDKSFQSLRDPQTGENAYPLDVAPLQCSRTEIRAFARAARDLGVQYVTLACAVREAVLRQLVTLPARTGPGFRQTSAILQLRAKTTSQFAVGDVENMSTRVQKNQLHLLGRKANKNIILL
ncbi:uncharacterized protein [Littorina saxatilis]|uniref:uncharacterized protein n=1 Tax=Littorina saxatilis TaxID=31220 RepID=UPI0038B60F67